MSRMFGELDSQRSIFDLPVKKFFLGSPDVDLSVRFHGKRASTPFGPAAGPQSQMAQNLVLSWLGGSRILELKTVQILDELDIPRPCIDMHNVGYNVEWSQELKLEQSLDEYVKGSMLIDMLVASGELDLAPGFDDVIYDMSVGYDLEGIKTERVQAFVAGMRDASAHVERLRAEIPVEFAELRDVEFRTELSDTLTLSTFHGCPPDEIERILEFLLEAGLNCVVKLNPTLLGQDEVRRLVQDVLGYGELVTPDSAFEKDAHWDQAVGFVERLKAKADKLGLGFGVKFNNTLIVQNHRDFFPATEKEMYLSGPPLHVLAIHLVDRFRGVFGDSIPISFSAGVDRHNFADAVALGLTPITVCSDLLKPGGYGRQQTYFAQLLRRMTEVGATSIDEFVQRTCGQKDQPVERARQLNTRAYVERVTVDERYSAPANAATPKKIGSQLELFDCVTCDKCVPVCPNDANFTFDLPQIEVPVVKLLRRGDRWESERAEPLVFERKHQIGNFADFCNECGNCDVFCPEDGGPYVMKPRFFGSRDAWARQTDRDGFHLHREGGRETVHGRFSGAEFTLAVTGGEASFSGDGFDVVFQLADPEGSVTGDADDRVDLTFFHIMDHLRRSLLGGTRLTYVNA